MLKITYIFNIILIGFKNNTFLNSSKYSNKDKHIRKKKHTFVISI